MKILGSKSALTRILSFCLTEARQEIHAINYEVRVVPTPKAEEHDRATVGVSDRPTGWDLHTSVSTASRYWIHFYTNGRASHSSGTQERLHIHTFTSSFKIQ